MKADQERSEAEEDSPLVFARLPTAPKPRRPSNRTAFVPRRLASTSPVALPRSASPETGIANAALEPTSDPIRRKTVVSYKPRAATTRIANHGTSNHDRERRAHWRRALSSCRRNFNP